LILNISRMIFSSLFIYSFLNFVNFHI
jgi:hypothetical protein